ncbi:hypothetical protein AVI51_08065 [Piscirickettsia salmonis]|uniref:Carboxylate/amino acid/amine transporter n=1 Tax=Piscirickettsia salmonis TaxID=1238 RepID=A0A9Q5VBV3_PISSA|nr:DMT family transporter [Piscirickettsia salmonis]ALA23980.1 eamA-like transporter family protein [Piscirickettsia salmonis]APS44392.1 hypothetical protein AVI48_08455 [Piscirickettsia salmonis]APS47753.1 hypothetical protein AVI49_09065 [Piscirickettsia salmonis]APS50817.1 hypothetical protein AVI50_08155 [Piscirickettsia salmonis]APS54021.1 hypothetical protein AVI51_08065 [Piscirickettsia salmonis]
MIHSSLIKGIALTLFSALSYASLAAVIKHHPEVPLSLLVFAQSLVCLVLILPIIIQQNKKTAGALKNKKSLFKTNYLHFHIIRAFFSLGISYCLFFALKTIPLVNGVLLANTSALFTPFLALLFFRQKINHKLWPAILIGFVGVAIILNPSHDGFLRGGALFALASALCVSSSMLFIRRTTDQDSGLTSAFYYFLLSSIISGVFLAINQPHLSTSFIRIILVTGLLFFCTQFALTLALQFIDAHIVSTLYYSNIVFAVLISVILLHAPTSLLMLGGIVLVCFSGIGCVYIQNKQKKHNIHHTQHGVTQTYATD